MLEVKNLLMRFNAQLLFEDVNLKLTRGNRYGLIGANGAGKSTFLKILAGEIEANSGEIIIENGLKVGVLGQDQFVFENFSVKDLCATLAPRGAVATLPSTIKSRAARLTKPRL